MLVRVRVVLQPIERLHSTKRDNHRLFDISDGNPAKEMRSDTAVAEGEGAKEKITLNNEQPASFPFLRLLPEIRVHIYNLLEKIPDHDGDQDRHEANEYDGFSKTRKSLLLTCRQINAEFTPHFYRSTTICFGPRNHAPQQFYAFMNELDPVKLSSIRHVEYRKKYYTASDYTDAEMLPYWLMHWGLQLDTFNVVYGDYVSSPILNSPLRMAIMIVDVNRPAPPRSVSWKTWKTFEASTWSIIVRESYVYKFTGFEREVLQRLMPEATIRREYGAGGFRIFVRRDPGIANCLAQMPRTEPTPVENPSSRSAGMFCSPICTHRQSFAYLIAANRRVPNSAMIGRSS